jgi:hypothetical protein
MFWKLRKYKAKISTFCTHSDEYNCFKYLNMHWSLITWVKNTRNCKIKLPPSSGVAVVNQEVEVIVNSWQNTSVTPFTCAEKKCFLCAEQCCWPMTFWCGSGFADPCLWLMDSDPDPDPEWWIRIRIRIRNTGAEFLSTSWKSKN